MKSFVSGPETVRRGIGAESEGGDYAVVHGAGAAESTVERV